MMSDDKIKISWDDIRTVPDQPAPAAPQAVAGGREAWGHVGIAPPGQAPVVTSAGSFLYRGWFYLGLAGFLSGLLAWGVSELAPVNAKHETAAARDEYFKRLVEKAERRHSNWDRIPQDRQIEILRDLDASETRINTGFWFAIVGTILAVGLGMVEGVVSRSTTQALRGGGLGLLGGAVGGFLAGVFAQWLYAILQENRTAGEGISAAQVLARSLGWAVAGGVVGSAFGLAYLSVKRGLLGVAGGFAGGLLGGILFDVVAQTSQSDILSRSIGITAIGLASGLLISLAEQVAKAAWLQIEAGRLVGKQFIVYRNPTRIGALPANEVYLFKDAAVAPEHARIERRGAAYFLVDNGSAGGTRVNGAFIREQRLRSGDAIQIGDTVLRYGERRAG